MPDFRCSACGYSFSSPYNMGEPCPSCAGLGRPDPNCTCTKWRTWGQTLNLIATKNPKCPIHGTPVIANSSPPAASP